MFVDPAPAKTTSSPKFVAPSTSKISRFAVPSTSISALRSILPVIPSVDPSNVRFASPFKFTPLPPVITRLSALFAIDTCVGKLVKFEQSQPLLTHLLLQTYRLVIHFLFLVLQHS